MHQPKTSEQRLTATKSNSTNKTLTVYFLLIVCLLSLQNDSIVLKCEAFSFSNNGGLVKQPGSCKTMLRYDDGSDSLEEKNKRRRQGIPRLRNPRRRMRIKGRDRFDSALPEETGTSTLTGSRVCEEDKEKMKVIKTNNRIGLRKRIRLLGQNRPRIQNFRPRRNINFVRNNWKPVIRIERFRRKNDTLGQNIRVANEENTSLEVKQPVTEDYVQEYLTTEQSGQSQKSNALQDQRKNDKDNKKNISNNISTRNDESKGSIKKDDDLRNIQNIVSSDNQQQKKNVNTKRQKGKRINITSKYKTSRVIVPTNEKVDGLLNEYMTQPITSFSLRSFHDTETPVAGRRRWMIRSLSKKEIMDHPKTSGGKVEKSSVDNIFRLAVPLMPLLGIDLTPIIDLEVMTATKSNDTTKSFFKSGKKPPSNVVQLRSMRMSLLATDNEMKKYSLNNPSLQKMKDPIPTKVSKDQSVRQMGNEAIHFAERLEKWLEPQLTFEADISWDNDTVDVCNDIEAQMVAVDSKASISLTIPPLPFGVPIPSSFLIKQIGSNILTRALKLALNQFLRQVEIDFKRWADVDK